MKRGGGGGGGRYERSKGDRGNVAMTFHCRNMLFFTSQIDTGLIILLQLHRGDQQ